MDYRDHRQRYLQSSISDTGVAPSAVFSRLPVALEPLFQGLGDMIKLVDAALTPGRLDAVIALIGAELPANIECGRADLARDRVRANGQGYRRIELHHSLLHGYGCRQQHPRLEAPRA